jgi:hypothetical protein
MKIEIEVPDLPEGADGACLGKGLPEGATIVARLGFSWLIWATVTPDYKVDDGEIVAYTLPPYKQELELPRPEPGYEWVVVAAHGTTDRIVRLVKKVKP